MTKSALTRWLTRLAWGLILFDLLLIFLVGSIHFDNMLLGLAIAAWLILTLLATSTWLIIHHRAFFRTWPRWATPLLSLILSDWLVQGILPIRYPPIVFFFTMLFIVSGWAVVLTTVIFLWYRDVGLRLIGWGLVIMMWMMTLAWRFQGNLIQLAFEQFAHQNQSPRLWWLNLFLCLIFCIIPLGVLSFVRHTIRLIRREWSCLPSPIPKLELGNEAQTENRDKNSPLSL